jgi:hypothetical protein
MVKISKEGIMLSRLNRELQYDSIETRSSELPIAHLSSWFP